MRPLEGLLVVDFSTLLPGPLASLILAEAGAEVIKVERPGGEDMRGFPPAFGTTSAPFAALNRGKGSVEIDLKAPDAVVRLTPLLRRADVLIEQFRPGVMARLGLGHPALSELNPGLVYCSISGFGQDGPLAQQAGHDINYQALAGLLSQSLVRGAAAPPPPALVADIAGGALPAVLNILLALRERDRTGRGCHLDVAMTDGAASFAWYGLAQGAATGAYPAGGATLLTGGSPRYRLYATADGWFLAVGALETKFWAAFCAAIGLAEALRDDLAAPETTAGAVAAIVASAPAAHWRGLLEPLDCCCTVVRSLAEAAADPHFATRGLFAPRAREAGGRTMPAAPVPLAPVFRRAGEAVADVPACGADGARHFGGGI